MRISDFAIYGDVGRQISHPDCPPLLWRAEGLPQSFASQSWGSPWPSSRKVVTRSPHRRVGRLPVPWLQDFPVSWESNLERDFCKQAAICPGVTGLMSEPVTFDIKDPSLFILRKRYSPDFLVSFDTGSKLVVEVRHSARLLPDLPFFIEIAARFNEAGYSFAVFTERQIYRTPVRVQNAGLIHRYTRNPSALSFASDFGPTFSGNFSQLCENFNLTELEAIALIGRGNFDYCLDLNLMSTAFFCQFEEGGGDECFCSKNWFGI